MLNGSVGTGIREVGFRDGPDFEVVDEEGLLAAAAVGGAGVPGDSEIVGVVDVVREAGGELVVVHAAEDGLRAAVDEHLRERAVAEAAGLPRHRVVVPAGPVPAEDLPVLHRPGVVRDRAERPAHERAAEAAAGEAVVRGELEQRDGAALVVERDEKRVAAVHVARVVALDLRPELDRPLRAEELLREHRLEGGRVRLHAQRPAVLARDEGAAQELAGGAGGGTLDCRRIVKGAVVEE